MCRCTDMALEERNMERIRAQVILTIKESYNERRAQYNKGRGRYEFMVARGIL